MEKQEILNHLLEKALEITAYLEEHCDYQQLYEDGLYAMLYIRYQNALSLLREDHPGYGRLRAGLQFLISANPIGGLICICRMIEEKNESFYRDDPSFSFLVNGFLRD